MAARKENVKLIVAIIVIFAAIVGFRAYRDMHPAPAPNLDITASYSYYAADDKTLDRVPEDQSSIYLKVGDFVTDKNGNTNLTLSGPTPRNFPQRDTELYFTLDKLPKDPSALYEKVANAIEPWKKVGNIFNDIVFNYTATNPDIDALEKFSTAAKRYVHMDFNIVFQIHGQGVGTTAADRNKLANALKSIQYFVYDFKEARLGNETLKQMMLRLNKQEVPFKIRLEAAPTDREVLDRSALKDLTHFDGFVLDTIPNAAPAPVKK